jgi:hypothetical protein
MWVPITQCLSLSMADSNQQNRSIIFIAHSFGGLLLKRVQALQGPLLETTRLTRLPEPGPCHYAINTHY